MRTLLVLGASADVGISLISRMAQDYDRIYAHYNCGSGELKALKEVLGDKLSLFQADFSSEESTCNMISEIRATEELPTHIVHLPAASCVLTKFAKADWACCQKNIEISLRSAYLVFQAFLPHMAKVHFGRVVVMLTAYTIGRAPKYLTDYVCQKYALLGLVKALASEYADKGVTINGVSPEMIETKYLKSIPSLAIEQNAMESPLGRNLTAEDVIPTIAFLLSDKAGCITGENMAITGGK